MLNKFNDLEAYLDSGEARVKIASANEIEQFCVGLVPDPKFMYLHVIALGDGEFYGCNKNGDYFPEKSLIMYHHTFEQGAKVFKEHNNKTNSPSYGTVVKSWHNPLMHRVELILAVDKDKAPDIVAKVERGEVPEVSMGCFPGKTSVNMSTGAIKNIEDVEVGDLVLTHTGKSRIVTDTMVRSYVGEMVSINAYGVGSSIQATSEHPFLVRRYIKRKNSGNCPACCGYYEKLTSHIWRQEDTKHKLLHNTWKDTVVEEGWVEAKNIRKGDFVVSPINSFSSEQGDAIFATLLGYYLAEGSLVESKTKKNKGSLTGVDWTFNISEEEYADEVKQCVEVLYGTKCSFYKRPDRNTLSVVATNSKLAEDMYTHGGRYCNNKNISTTVMSWSPEIQLILLNSYINGDGTWNKHYKHISWKTVSSNLHHQLIEICKRNRLYVNVFIDKSVNVKKRQVVYTGMISGNQCKNIRENVNKIDKEWNPTDHYEAPLPQGGTCTRSIRSSNSFVEGSNVYRRVASVSSEYMETAVHNFSVAEDESYQVHGIAVHNCRVPHDVCSICGNKAAKKHEYCDHITKELKHVYPDGRQAYMMNLQPTFFDISFVFRRADKLGVMLKKVAGEVGNIDHVFDAEEVEDKVASIDKEIPAEAFVKILNKGMFNLLPKLEEVEPDLPPALLDRLAARYSLQDILHSFNHNLVPMKPREVTRIIIIQNGLPMNNYDDVLNGILHAQRGQAYPGGNYQDEVGELLSKFLPSRSSYGPHVVRRVLSLKLLPKTASEIQNPNYYSDAPYYDPAFNNELTHYKYNYSTIPVMYDRDSYQQRKQEQANRSLRKPLNPFGLALMLGAMYAAYRGVNGLESIVNTVTSPKGVAIAGAAALATVGALRGNSYTKQASMLSSKAMTHYVMPFVGAHLASAHYRNKYMNGQDLNGIQMFIAENPDYLSIAAPVAMHLGSSQLGKAKGAISAAKNSFNAGLGKTASNTDDYGVPLEKLADFADNLSQAALTGIIFKGRGASVGSAALEQGIDASLMRHAIKVTTPPQQIQTPINLDGESKK